MTRFRFVLLATCLSWLCVPICLAEEAPEIETEAGVTGTSTSAQEACSAPSALAEAGIEDPQVWAGTRAFCRADCGNFPDVSCSAKGTCTAVDRDCSTGERGYVTCGSQTTFCPACACIEGQVRYTTTSECCCNYDNPDAPERLHKQIREICVNGAWVYNGVSCTGSPCGPGPPCPV